MPPGEKLHFFISHASENADYAKWLDGLLRAAGHHTTTQGYDFRPGRSFLDLMQDALAKSDHVLTLYSAAFFKKDFPLKELYSALAKDGLNRRRKLIPIRIEEIEIPDLLADFIFIDLFNKPEDQATEAILNAIKPEIERTPVAYPGPQSTIHRTSIASLPSVDPTLIGREPQLALLNAAWNNPAVNFFQIIAPGGTGKTALMSKWYKPLVGRTTIFGWSFFSQGAGETSQTSSDPFFAAALPFFHVNIPPTADVYVKAEALAGRLAQERALLILDGLEPLQEISGRLPDPGLLTLLKELAAANMGLVLCTTRVRLTEIPDDEPQVQSLDLDNLSPDDGVRYLRHFDIEGTDDELREASIEYGNRALALTLLGTYLAEFCRRDIRRHTDIPALIDPALDQGQHAHRAMAAYERMYKGKPELDILKALGYFDRPAEPEALKLVLPAMDSRSFQRALTGLRKARLALTDDPEQPLDCHPLVREHFAREASKEGHSRLYDHYCKKAPNRPDTLKEMTPLFYAIYHGCRAGRYEEACSVVFRDRILRGEEFYFYHKLGAFGTSLSLLANFFESPWSKPVTDLSAADQSWVNTNAAFALRALGRLGDAVAPERAGAEADLELEHWTNAAKSYSNLAHLYIALGNLTEAIEFGRKSVELSDQSGVPFTRSVNRAILAAALHQSGNLAEATSLFEEAERINAERQPQQPLLSSLLGYLYCDLLLDKGQAEEVIRRASQTIVWFQNPLGVGLDHLILGRAQAPGDHFDEAVHYVREAAQLNYLPPALLARGTDHDLDEVFRIATRSGMRLHLADYYLAMARRQSDPTHLAKAQALIEETGYHRRDGEVGELR